MCQEASICYTDNVCSSADHKLCDSGLPVYLLSIVSPIPRKMQEIHHGPNKYLLNERMNKLGD